jgi:hypothetical protein
LSLVVGRTLRRSFVCILNLVSSEISWLEEIKSVENKSQVIWAVMKCHIKLKSLSSLNSRAIWRLFTKSSLILLTERVGPNTIKKLQPKVATVETEACTAIQLMRELEEKVLTQKRQMNNLKNDVSNIKAQNGCLAGSILTMENPSKRRRRRPMALKLAVTVNDSLLFLPGTVLPED